MKTFIFSAMGNISDSWQPHGNLNKVTKPKRFLDSLREMVSPAPDKTCAACHTSYAGELCPSCGKTFGNGSSADKTGTKSAYLVDLVSNHKIQIPIPICKVGRDECNDIVISGDQAISRQHLIILKDGEQFFVEDAKSRHGTFINGTQIRIKEPINDGDVLKIGVSLFWFVAEASEISEDGSSTDSSGRSLSSSSKQSNTGGEPQHVNVKSEFFLEPTDPSTSTATDIPVMTNEEVLVDHLRLKTRSFEGTDLLVQAQLQPGALRSPRNPDTGIPASSTQSHVPAIDSILASARLTESQDSAVAIKSPEVQTIAASSVTPVAPAKPAPAPLPKQQSLNDYLSQLSVEHDQLKAQIEQAEKRKQEIAHQIATAKELVKSLIGGSEGVLMTACQKVLSQLGWQCAGTGEDGQDLQLKADNQTLIVHIMWTAAKPDRTHLGKLFIAQTRFWCDQGIEPKGILIISLLSRDNAPKSQFVLSEDVKAELANFVKNKNVCLLTTANLLAIYHAITLNHLDSKIVREKVMHTDGWLEGFDLEPLA